MSKFSGLVEVPAAKVLERGDGVLDQIDQLEAAWEDKLIEAAYKYANRTYFWQRWFNITPRERMTHEAVNKRIVTAGFLDDPWFAYRVDMTKYWDDRRTCRRIIESAQQNPDTTLYLPLDDINTFAHYWDEYTARTNNERK